MGKQIKKCKKLNIQLMQTVGESNNNTALRKTYWYVITGGPGSGKTTMVNLLKARGHKTTIENAELMYAHDNLKKGSNSNEPFFSHQMSETNEINKTTE